MDAERALQNLRLSDMIMIAIIALKTGLKSKVNDHYNGRIAIACLTLYCLLYGLKGNRLDQFDPIRQTW